MQSFAYSAWRRGHGVKRVAVNERGYRIGTSHPNSKLSDATIELILELRDAGLSYGAIAAKFDDPAEPTVSKSMVYQVCQGLKRSQVVARVKTVPDAPLSPLQALARWFREVQDPLDVDDRLGEP